MKENGYGYASRNQEKHSGLVPTIIDYAGNRGYLQRTDRQDDPERDEHARRQDRVHSQIAETWMEELIAEVIDIVSLADENIHEDIPQEKQ
jgi:hypothetical protein